MQMAENEIMVPTNDYIFRRIFGYKGNEEITKELISAIIGEGIKEIKLDESPILEKDLIDDKLGVLDVKVRLDNDTICDIEMQVSKIKDIEKRIMLYWSKMYSGEIKKGNKYEVLKRTIVILIADFELDNLKEIEKYHTKWQIREEKYSKIVLTSVFEAHIIELSKLMKQLKKNEEVKNDKVALWAQFIKRPETLGEKEMSENNMIKRAKEELTKVQQDARERYLAEQRECLERDMMAREDYGYDNGLKDGEKKGIKESQRQVVLNMYKSNVRLEDICKYVELTKEEVEKIINESSKK